jgi:KDO2-lipid IV(A) lauroyltransferase
VSDNLLRVCRYLVDNQMAGSQTTKAAADGQALARLVRKAFGHYVRSYLESASLPAYSTPERLARIAADDPAALEQAFPEDDAQLILVCMHFGAIEIPGLWATRARGLSITAPMETVADPDLQSYFEQTRGESGLNVIPLAGAASALRAALAAGDSVALVADRPVGGSGTLVELFGAPARLPAGPALLALESGVPAWLAATRRVGFGDYRTRLERIDLPSEGTRRERLAGFMAAEAAAFERAIADSPEQWWTLFFPIWDDAPATEAAA